MGLLCWWMMILALLQPPAGAADEGITFIVNRSNPVKTLSRSDVADFFEKKQRRWPDGAQVRFIDHDPGSPERARFLKSILNKSESEVDLFWFSQKIHTGDSMPTQISTDSMVIEMVKVFRGAIGYISSATPLPADEVRKVKITERKEE